MASQDVVVTYRAEVDDLTQKLKLVIDRMDRLETESKQAAKGLDTTTKSADKLDKELNDVGKSTKKAGEDLKIFSKTASSGLGAVAGNIKTIGLGIATGFAAALSTGAITAFAKASVNAFLEADKVAQKLKNTIVAVNGESNEAFERLIKQSAELQDISIFSDDSIQQAQAALAAFGLTADQIEDLIPKLADFATISNTDIVQAAQQVGAGLEGTGREFKKYGIEVTATASRFENFNSILNGFVKFQGAASNAAQTFAGKLAQQENKIDDLQEKIGQKLLPAFLKIKEFGLRAIEVIADLFGTEAQSQAEKAAETYSKITSEFNVSIEVLKRGNLTQEQRNELIKEINTQYGEYLPNLLTEKSSLEDIEKAQAAVNKQLEGRIILVALEEDIVRITKNSAAAVKALIEVQKDRVRSEKDLQDNAGLAELTRDQLNQREALANELIKTGRDELAALQEQYAKLAAQLGINLTGTNKLLAAQMGVNEASDVRIAGSAAEIESLKRLSSEYSALFELLSDQDKSQLIELSITAQIDNADQIQDKIKQLEAIFKANDLTIPVKVEAEDLPNLQQQFELIKTELEAQGIAIPIDITQLETLEAKVAALRQLATDAGITIPIEADPDQSIEGLQRRFNQLKTELEAKGVTIPVSINETALEEFRAKVAQLKADQDKELTIPIKLEVPDTKEFTDMVDGIKDGAEDASASFEEIVQASVQLLDSLTALNAAFTENRLREINTIKDAEIAALDSAQEAVNDNLAKRRISETEANKLSEQLTAKKLATEKKAADEERKIRRKQFDIDKAAALVKIAINTAVAVTENLSIPVVAALVAAAGAVEATVVASQPNPYKKGTKSAKQGLAQVDEQGSEAILRVREGRLTMLDQGDKVLPAHKTVTYGKVLDTMFDGTFDKHYMKKEMAPRLVKQRELHEKAEKKSFARNISESLVINSQLNVDPIARQLAKGQIINNADEIGQAVARHLQSDPYR